MTILVAGGSGLVGSAIVQEFLSNQVSVSGFSSTEVDLRC